MMWYKKAKDTFIFNAHTSYTPYSRDITNIHKILPYSHSIIAIWCYIHLRHFCHLYSDVKICIWPGSLCKASFPLAFQRAKPVRSSSEFGCFSPLSNSLEWFLKTFCVMRTNPQWVVVVGLEDLVKLTGHSSMEDGLASEGKTITI